MLMEVRKQEVMKKEVTTGDTLILTIMYKSTLRYFFVFPCLKKSKLGPNLIKTFKRLLRRLATLT